MKHLVIAGAIFAASLPAQQALTLADAEQILLQMA